MFAGTVLFQSLLAFTKPTVVVVVRPTVVAFFVPETGAELNDPDTNEARADFQLYAGEVRKPLHDAGIDFREIYASSFRIRSGTKVTTFRPHKDKVGYYLIAPGRTPRIEYGVMTNSDLLQVSNEYFGITTK